MNGKKKCEHRKPKQYCTNKKNEMENEENIASTKKKRKIVSKKLYGRNNEIWTLVYNFFIMP